MPTITPATPQIKAALAVLTFSGSPWAVKNKTPATKKQITATPPNIKPAAISMPCIMGEILVTHGPPAGHELNCAKTRPDGHADKIKIPDQIKNNIFLFIPVGFWPRFTEPKTKIYLLSYYASYYCNY